MKKLSKKKKWYLIRYYRRLIKNSKKIKHRNTKINKSLSINENSKPIPLNAPRQFSLIRPDDRVKLLNFIENIEKSVISKRKVIISFNNTELLEPNGTLLFVAKVERLIEINPGYVFCKYPKNEVVEQLFQHIGLLSKFGLSPRASITADNVKHWHYTQGKSADTTDFRSLFKTYACKLDEEVSESLYDSMAEAVTNCIMHAYDEDAFITKKLKVAFQEKAWWMFAQYKDEKLTVVILDLGIGIPISLQLKPEFKEIVFSSISAIKKRKETELIEIAVQSTRSRTKLRHRGLGLPEMLENVKSGNVGRFLVLSGRGAFHYDAKYGLESRIKKDYREVMPGTLIQWEIEIPSYNH